MTPQDEINRIIDQSLGKKSPTKERNINDDINDILGTPNAIVAPPKQEVQGTWGAVVSTIAPVLDFISRPQYASAKFFDSLGSESTSILDAAINAGQELLDPKERLSFSDLIRKNAPQWSKENSKSTEVLGFVLDIALDPTTYLTFGTGTGLKIGGKTLTKVGLEALETGIKQTGKKTALYLGQGETLEVVQSLTKELARKRPNIAKVATYTNKLQADGYFEEVINRGEEIGDLFKNLTGKDVSQAAIDVARDEVYDDLLKAAKNKTYLATHEIRERAEARIGRLTSVEPAYAEQLFQKQGLRVQAGLPFGKKYDIPGSVELLNVLGLNKLHETIKVLPVRFNVAGKIAQTFGKNAGLPEEYIKARTILENEFDAMKDDIVFQTQKMFRGMNKEGREKIGRLMSEIDDATRELDSDLLPIKPHEASIIANKKIAEARLTPEEHSLVANLFQSYKNAGQIEMRAGLLGQVLQNYNPRYYEAIKDVDNASLMQLFTSRNPLSKTLNSSKHRHYLTLEEAAAKGLNPEMDAALLYATRMLSSRRALAVKQFEEAAAPLFGSKTLRGIKNKRIVDDLKLLGDAVYPAGMDDTAKYWLQYWDKANRVFRTAATIAKPSFGFKQLVSNTVQTSMIQGLKAFKSFDPRAVIDASLLVLSSRNLKVPEKLPAFVDNIISKQFQGRGNAATLASRVALSHLSGEARLFDYAKDFKLRTALGQEYTGEEIVDLARSHGILRGVTVTGDQFKRKIEQEITKEFGNKPKLIGELMQYWKHPGMVEDYNRMMLFVNGIRMGHTPMEAQKLVNKALFDYHRGLSKVERNVFRRVLPFYTFQRFALPFVLQQGIAKPAIPATAQKLMATMEKLMVPDADDRLTESERELLPGFLLNQPRLFRGMDAEGKLKFNVFNNMTPLDVASILQFDDDGNFSPKKTAEHSILAALTPFIKAPLETVFKKDFFTGRTIEDAVRLGGPTALTHLLPEPVKQMIGWEERVNVRNGKVTTYVSPYLGHWAMSVFPSAKQFIKATDPEKSILETSMEQLFGIGTFDVDLKEQRGFQVSKFRKDVEDARRRLRSATLKGSKSEAQKAKDDLEKFIQNFKKVSPVQGESVTEVPVESPQQ